MQKSKELQKLLSLKEASRLLNCHPNTLRQWDRKGILSAVRIGQRGIRKYRKKDILRLINNVSSPKSVGPDLIGVSSLGPFKKSQQDSLAKNKLKAEQVLASQKTEELLGKLQQSEIRYRTMIEQSPLSTQILSPNGKTLMVNKAWENLWGAKLEYLKDYNMLSDKQLIELGIMPYIKKGFMGEPTHIPAVKYYPNKTILDVPAVPYRWVSAIIYPVKDDRGKIQEIVLIHQDITDQKDAAEKVQQSEQQLQSIIDSSLAVIYVKDVEGKYILINRQYELLFKIKRQKIKDKTDYDLFPEDIADTLRANDQDVLAAMKPLEQEENIPQEDGLHTYISVKFPLFDKTGKSYAVCGISTDITERKQQEESQQFLTEASKILSSSLDYKTTLSNVAKLAVPNLADWCIVYIKDENEVIQRLTIASVDREKMKSTRKIQKEFQINPHAKNGVPYVIRTGKSLLYKKVSPELLVSDVNNPKELLAIVKEFNVRSWICVPLSIRNNIFGAVSFISNKVSYSEKDLRLAEELASRASIAIENARLYEESQKAVTLRDDFISVASHELKTPVTSLKMYTQVLQKQFVKRKEDHLAQYFDKVDDQVSKLTVLISDLLNVSKLQHGKLEFTMEAFDINNLINETVDAIAPITRKHKIMIEGEIKRKVYGDRYRIYQVISNLLTNAIKYSPLANKVVVRLTPERDMAAVSVQDFGIGIELEHQKKIFQQFYRVSDPNEKTFPGMGMGLFISHEIIKRHGGEMSVVSSKGKGSQLSFTLPYSHSKNK